MTKDNVLFGKQWIDIVFENRNQSYGAYELRQISERNHAIAIFSVLAAFLFMGFSIQLYHFLFPAKADLIKDVVIEVTDVTMPPPDLPKPKENPVKNGAPPASDAKPEMRVTANAPDAIEEDTMEHQEALIYSDNATPGEAVGAGGTSESGSSIPAEEVPVQPTAEIVNFAEEMPSFPGGEEALFKYILTNVSYPDYERENDIEGQAFVSFVVTSAGKITDVKTVRSDSRGFSRASESVVRSLPAFKPGRQNGKPVNVRMVIPIKFRMKR